MYSRQLSSLRIGRAPFTRLKPCSRLVYFTLWFSKGQHLSGLCQASLEELALWSGLSLDEAATGLGELETSSPPLVRRCAQSDLLWVVDFLADQGCRGANIAKNVASRLDELVRHAGLGPELVAEFLRRYVSAELPIRYIHGAALPDEERGDDGPPSKPLRTPIEAPSDPLRSSMEAPPVGDQTGSGSGSGSGEGKDLELLRARLDSPGWPEEARRQLGVIHAAAGGKLAASMRGGEFALPQGELDGLYSFLCRMRPGEATLAEMGFLLSDAAGEDQYFAAKGRQVISLSHLLAKKGVFLGELHATAQQRLARRAAGQQTAPASGRGPAAPRIGAATAAGLKGL